MLVWNFCEYETLEFEADLVFGYFVYSPCLVKESNGVFNSMGSPPLTIGFNLRVSEMSRAQSAG